MPQFPVAYVDVRFCAHATEDVEKVMKAVRNILSIKNEEDEIAFNKNSLDGHYGNPIVFFDARIKNKTAIKALVGNLSENLSSLDKVELSSTLDRCFEKGSIYLRVDKQAALQGKIKLVACDPIRIRLRFRKTKLEDVTQVCKEIGMLT
ncbi:MAG: RNA-binding domain-containing protein [Candidatus Bathyarchaeota archaeon]|nr:RNA-binding domain-containing protein [Candidatus Bathyarchaeum tardum]